MKNEHRPAHPRFVPIRINVEETYEVRHWAKGLGVTEVQLLAAIEKVGPLVDSVKHYFEGQSDGPVPRLLWR